MTASLLFLIACLLRAASFRKSFACSGGRVLIIPSACVAAFGLLGLFRFGMAVQVVVLLECCPGSRPF